MESAKRCPRSQAKKLNQTKPSGEPAFDKNTGAPCPHDACNGEYKDWAKDRGQKGSQ